MEQSVGFCLKYTLFILVLSGFCLQGLNSQSIANLKPHFKPKRLLQVYKVLRGPLHVLRHCRRQLTFIGSSALGAFITRVIKDSPLTPLPMPPIDNPPRWNFLTLPLQMAAPYMNWVRGFPGNPHFKDSDMLPSSWRTGRLDNIISNINWRDRSRYRRDLFRMLKPSPHTIAKAVSKTLEALRFTDLESRRTQHWLARWCH